MSIRKRLTIIMLAIGLVPTLAVSVIAYAIISNSLTRKTADQLVSAATKQEQRINGLLQKKQEEAIELTNKFDLQSALGRYLASAGKDGQGDLNAILLNKKVGTPDIQTIEIADLQGKIVASTIRGNEGKRLAAQDYSLAVGQETATTVREDTRDGIDKLYITTKVNVNKKEAAYMSVIFRIDDIVAAIQDYTGLGATGETVVAEKDKNGDAVSLFPLRFDTDAALNAKLNSLQLFTTFNDGYKDATDYRGHTVMVAAKSIGFADWVIATKIDQDEALAQIGQLRNALLAIFVVSSLTITAVALYFTRYFTRPILRLAQVAHLIGEGDFSAQINLRRNDEIGTLAASITAMGYSLRDFVARIEAQRNRLAVILNSTAEGILALDAHGTIVIANRAAAELAQMDINAIVGKNINDIFHWTQDAQPFQIDYAAATAEIYTDLEYVDPAGISHYIKLIVAHASGEQGQKAAQTIVTIHDQTKSRELEDMKIDFVSMAAHELRTPLAAIRGYLELITFKAGRNAATEIDKYLHQALKSTSELGGLINNLLDVTRIERGTLAFNLEKVDLAAGLQQSIQDARFSAEDKHITLTYNGPVRDCFVIADQIALHEVINNLISNAIKYTDPNGTVEVSLAEKDGVYAVSVKDTGMGIPKQAQPNLFTKFYRVHGGLNSGSTGTGLGLFISKSIIERHNGTIGVQSEEGVGSTFTFTLPVFSAELFAKVQTLQQPQQMTRRRRGWVTKNIAR